MPEGAQKYLCEIRISQYYKCCTTVGGLIDLALGSKILKLCKGGGVVCRHDEVMFGL